MAAVLTRSDARSRTLEALAAVSAVYGLPSYTGALSRSDGEWQAEAIAHLAEVVAALLLDVRPGSVAPPRHRSRPRCCTTHRRHRGAQP